ncbi:MAG TPA: flavin reductase family protein [Chitinophagaceae bacterium]|nr:MAG: flavin reductase [Bacteroidetes bacterium OLB11]HMN33779.1 flavin reductase family protein [Chitinophagaceae bacterium]
MRIIPHELKTSLFHSYLLGSVSPRPICFASTIDKNGFPNLSPFSFFNTFGSKPPIMIFSPARRVRDNTIKHTLENILDTKEVVINVVNYPMVQQASLSSCEYPKEVNEFIKSGFTPIESEIVKPFRVKESPAQFECKVLDIIHTGTEGGAGNLIICEVLLMHLNDDVLDAEGQIDPHKIDLVARMGKDYYCRASGDAVFEVPKPNSKLGMGFDALPEVVKHSQVLSGNHLGQLANFTEIPAKDEQFIVDSSKDLFQLAKDFLDKNDADSAWQVLLRVIN